MQASTEYVPPKPIALLGDSVPVCSVVCFGGNVAFGTCTVIALCSVTQGT